MKIAAVGEYHNLRQIAVFLEKATADYVAAIQCVD
jgi:hypothetical protein